MVQTSIIVYSTQTKKPENEGASTFARKPRENDKHFSLFDMQSWNNLVPNSHKCV